MPTYEDLPCPYCKAITQHRIRPLSKTHRRSDCEECGTRTDRLIRREKRE